MANPVYTGEMVRTTDPDRYDGIVRAIATGEGLGDIAERFSCSKHTILAIRRNHPELIKQAQYLLGRSFQEAATIAAEEAKKRLLDNPDSIPFNQLMIGAGIATDKSLVLTGQATERIEVVVRHDDDEFDQIIKRAKKAEVIDLDSTQCTILNTSVNALDECTILNTHQVDGDNRICPAPAGTKAPGPAYPSDPPSEGNAT
jgi:hypothetical protein